MSSTITDSMKRNTPVLQSVEGGVIDPAKHAGWPVAMQVEDDEGVTCPPMMVPLFKLVPVSFLSFISTDIALLSNCKSSHL
jgi:hypothetical protein